MYFISLLHRFYIRN